MDNYDSLTEIEKRRKIELKKIENEKEAQRIEYVVEEMLIKNVIEHFGVDRILDTIGFDACKEYFKIELESE